MKQIIKLLSSAATAAFIVACNGTSLEIDTGETMPDPGPEVTPEATLSFSKELIEIGGSMFDEGEATMITNQTVFNATASETWVNPVFEGKILKAVAAEANDTGSERTATITVTAGKDDNTATATISVRQGIRDESSETTILNVADPNAELEASANSTAEVTFETNKTDVTITVPEDASGWLGAEIQGTKVIFTALKDNASGTILETKALLSAGSGEGTVTREINVRQLTSAPEGLAVGALYEGGIIFEVTDDYVKIMSLKGSKLLWSTEQELVGTESNPAEGIENTEKIKAMPNFETAYPGPKWCVDQGEGWYMPSRSEYNTLATAFAEIGWESVNAFITSYGGDEILSDQYHLTSCEKDASKAWVVRLSDKGASSFSKSGSERYVRAIRKIAR